MKKKLNIGIIGGGNMGSAIISGLKGKYRICVCEKDAKRSTFLRNKYRAAIVDLKTLINQSRVVILAVKPQDFEHTLKELNEFITSKHLVISIAAGITTKYIEKYLGKIRVIRTMPNLNVLIREGTTAISKGKYAADSDLRTAYEIFKNIGKVIIVSENKLDVITAVSGSGPAYYFLFAEAFAESAKKAGLSSEEAEFCIDNTLAGSAMYYSKSGEDATTLKEKVTSKGGTTQAALEEFSKGNFKSIFTKAIKAAKKRSKELSR